MCLIKRTVCRGMNLILIRYYESKISGDFYIGGTQGFTAFNPLEITKNEVPPNIVITDFRVFNESIAI